MRTRSGVLTQPTARAWGRLLRALWGHLSPTLRGPPSGILEDISDTDDY